MNGDGSIPWERFDDFLPLSFKNFQLSTEGLIPFIIELCRKYIGNERDLNFPLSLFLSCLPLIKKKKDFRMALGLWKNCKDSTETSHVFYTQSLLSVTPYMSVIHLSKLMNKYWYLVINKSLYSYFFSFYLSFCCYCCCSVILFRIPCYI